MSAHSHAWPAKSRKPLTKPQMVKRLNSAIQWIATDWTARWAWDTEYRDGPRLSVPGAYVVQPWLKHRNNPPARLHPVHTDDWFQSQLRSLSVDSRGAMDLTCGHALGLVAWQSRNKELWVDYQLRAAARLVERWFGDTA